MNAFGKLGRFPEKTRTVVGFHFHFHFHFYLAAAITMIRRLITAATHHYRWEAMPTSTPPMTNASRSSGPSASLPD